MFVPCTALLYDSTAATRTLKLSTTLLSISCGIRLISLLMLSFLVWGLFSHTRSFRYTLQKIVRWVEILGIGWPGVVGLMRNESVPWEVIPEVFKCSVWEMRWHLISQTEQNTWIPQAKSSMGQTHFTSNRDLPRSQPAWLFSKGVPDRQSLWKQSTDKRRQLSEEKSDWFHKKCSIEL